MPLEDITFPMVIPAIEQLAKQLHMSRSALPAFRDANPYAMNYAIAGTRAGPTAPIPVLTFAYHVSLFWMMWVELHRRTQLFVIEIYGPVIARSRCAALYLTWFCRGRYFGGLL